MKPSSVLVVHHPLSMTTILHCPHFPNPIYYLPKLPTLHPPYIGVLLTDFKKFYAYFMKTAMFNFHASPCSYCSRLLYPLSAKWVTRDNNIVYPLETNNPRNPTK